MRLFRKHPWVWVIVAFLVLISAWTGLIMIALENKPQVIEVSE